MNRFTKLAFLLCLALTASAVSHAAFAAPIDAQTSERLDALERENAALKQRLNRIENSVATPRSAIPRAAGQPAGLGTPGSASTVLDAHPQDNRTSPVYKSQAIDIGTSNSPPRFEVSGSLSYLQPGAGNLEYATLVSPLPLPSPNWSNQSLNPNFSPAFRVGLRYIPTASNDIQLNWTHLNTTANASVFATPTQMVGPPYEIGPDAAVFQIAHGTLNFAYDSVNLDAGHTFCAGCAFQLRVFGGAEFARIGQTVSGAFQSLDGLTAATNTNHSLFTGAGPRLGMKGQYGIGNFQFFGEAGVAGLVGTRQSRINFSATSPAWVGLGNTLPNAQSFTSPNGTQVIPSFDARIGTAYIFPPSNYGQFKIEVGYQTAVHMNAINYYGLTEVTVPPVAGSVGVFFATAQHLQTTFTTQGPYLTGSWSF
jgi:hypothetical protein